MTWTVSQVRVAKLQNYKGEYTVVVTMTNDKKEEEDLYADPQWSFNSWTDIQQSTLPTTFTSPDGSMSVTLRQGTEAFADMFQQVKSVFG
jgi:hypothetical protein